MVGLWLYGR